jgi:formylglycine-generating enzyme required for sulfatase activity
MKERFPRIAAALVLAVVGLLGQGPPATGRDPAVPPELIRMTVFAAKLAKNPQGCWEAMLADGIVMVYVPAGEFLMGSLRGESGSEPDEHPVHRVFTTGIWIGKYEVTRVTWQTIMGGEAVRPDEQSLPQINVSYEDVQAFLRALRKKSGLNFRLPTEAEWEKCCRAGNSAPQYGPLDEIAWHAGNSGGRSHPVGKKRPNGFGLHDMLGNVWEWCADWYGKEYYGMSPITDPGGPERGRRRVTRGGGYLHGGNYLRSAHRNDQDPAQSRPFLGFRLVLDLAL